MMDKSGAATLRHLPVMVTFVFMAGCSSQPMETPGDGGQHACTVSLEQVQAVAMHEGEGPACPATYAQAMQMPPACGPMSRPVTVAMCSGFLVLSANCSLTGFVCAYDAVSLVLVGAAAFNDTSTYCQRTSSCIQGGTLPSEVACVSWFLRHTCVPETMDGGALDATGADI